MICPLLSINFFWYQKVSGKQKGSCTKLFVWVMWDKSSDKTLMPPPPLLCMKIFDKRIFLKQQSILLWNISVQRDKKFSTENLDTPIPPSYPNFFNIRIYCNSKGIPYGNFRHCETKNFRRKILIPPPLLSKLFRYPKFSETQHKKVHLPNFSALGDKKIRQKIENRDITLWSIKFFNTRN